MDNKYKKAVETRRKHKEAIEKKERAEAEQQKVIKAAMLEVITSKTTTPAQKLEAVRYLTEIKKGSAF